MAIAAITFLERRYGLYRCRKRASTTNRLRNERSLSTHVLQSPCNDTRSRYIVHKRRCARLLIVADTRRCMAIAHLCTTQLTRNDVRAIGDVARGCKKGIAVTLERLGESSPGNERIGRLLNCR